MNEMSQQDLEDKTGVSKRSISRLEQGESVQVDNLFIILLALGLGDNIESSYYHAISVLLLLYNIIIRHICLFIF